MIIMYKWYNMYIYKYIHTYHVDVYAAAEISKI